MNKILKAMQRREVNVLCRNCETRLIVKVTKEDYRDEDGKKKTKTTARLYCPKCGKEY